MGVEREGRVARMGKSMDRQKNFRLALWPCGPVPLLPLSRSEEERLSSRFGAGRARPGLDGKQG